MYEENDLQAYIDQFKSDAYLRNWAKFAHFWRLKYQNNNYDPFGNFMYGVTGRAAGFTGKELQTAANEVLKLGQNKKQNIRDIQAGIDFYDKGATFLSRIMDWE